MEPIAVRAQSVVRHVESNRRRCSVRTIIRIRVVHNGSTVPAASLRGGFYSLSGQWRLQVCVSVVPYLSKGPEVRDTRVKYTLRLPLILFTFQKL